MLKRYFVQSAAMALIMSKNLGEKLDLHMLLGIGWQRALCQEFYKGHLSHSFMYENFDI